MVSNASPLALDYAFTPTPYPILASPSSANPSTVSLEVIVSNPSTQAIPMPKLTILIPTGVEASRDISTAPSLPAPSYDTSIPWRITTAGGTVTIVPAPGTSGQVMGPIIFTLPGIQVNQTPGTVPIIITEFPPGKKVQDDATYSLLKRPANFPVMNFKAVPSALIDVDLPVTLYWTCSTQGQGYDYGLRIVSEARSSTDLAARTAPASPGVALKNCVSDGNCYSCSDGANGVPVGRVGTTTTFALDVVGTDPSGHPVVVDTLDLMVPVKIPSISPASKIGAQSRFGRLVRLHWLATNAVSCSVVVGSKTVVTNAPVDTYVDGYPLVITQPPGLYSIQIVANGPPGGASARFTLGEVTVASPEVPVGQDVGGMALTPDGAHALVTVAQNRSDFQLVAVDTTTGRLSGSPIHLGDGTGQVAATPDGKTAVILNASSRVVTLVDIVGGKVVAPGIGLAGTAIESGQFAITPDGRYAVIPGYGHFALNVIDIPGRQLAKSVDLKEKGTYAIAISPTGFALLSNVAQNTITVVNCADFTPAPSQITVAANVLSIVITPNGTTALVVNASTTMVYAIDLSSPARSTTPIDVGDSQLGIAATPDSTTALVSLASSATVVAIDVVARNVIGSISVPSATTGQLAVSPDGRQALGGLVDSVTVLDMVTLTQIGTIPLNGAAVGLAYTQDGATAAVLTWTGTGAPTRSGSVVLL